MKSMMLLAAVALMGVSSETPKPIPNPLIDYAGFEKIVDSSEKQREERRLSEADLMLMMQQKGVIVLDARSASKYVLRHIKGAVNLPFTDFTADTLSTVIPTKDTKILIYCNNNFLGSPIAFTSKAPTASLNLSTYTSLKSYGYENVYELGPLLNVSTTLIPFEGTEVK